MMHSADRTVHPSDYVLEKTDLPDELITGAAGQVVFEEENFLVCLMFIGILCIVMHGLTAWWVQVGAFNHFPQPEINSASQSLIPNHMRAWPNVCSVLFEVGCTLYLALMWCRNES